MCSSYGLSVARAAHLAPLMLLASCFEARMTPEIPVPTDTKSLAIVVSSTGTPVQYHVHLANTPGFALAAALEREDRVRALALGCSLDELGLTPGWQPVDAVRPLPARTLLGIAELLPNRRDWAPFEGGIRAMGFLPKVAGEACSRTSSSEGTNYEVLEANGNKTRTNIDLAHPWPGGARLVREATSWVVRSNTAQEVLPSRDMDFDPETWLATFVDRDELLYSVRRDGIYQGRDVIGALDASNVERAWMSGSPDGSELCILYSDGQFIYVDVVTRALIEIVAPRADARTPRGVAWSGPGACVAIGAGMNEGEVLEWSKMGSAPRTLPGDLSSVAAIPQVGVLVGAKDGALHFIGADGQVVSSSDEATPRLKAVAAVGETFLVATADFIFEYVPGFGRCTPHRVKGVFLAAAVRDGLITYYEGEAVVRRRPNACSTRF